MPHFRWKPAGLLIAALLLASQPGSVPAAEIASLPTAREATPRMFGKREIHSSNLSQFTRWTGLLARWKAQRAAAAKSCNAPDAAASACTPPEWTGLVERLRGLPLRRQLAAVNDAINAHPYVSAVRNWGDPAYWETPFEFMRANGQCQDYAITKFLLLRELGVPNDRMRLVVLRDVRRQVDHAVLVVSVEGEELLLDNLIDGVVPASAPANYRAYYSINETGWWLHLPNPLIPGGVVSPVASR